MAGVALLLRHGETEWNVTGRMQGLSDTQLTSVGVLQAQEAVKKLPRFQSIISSPLKRALVTAEIVGRVQNVPITTDARLLERSWGAWEGLLPAEVEERCPRWLAEDRKPEGYEDDAQIWRRLEPLFEELSRDVISDQVLLVSHGGLILAVIRTLGGADKPLGNLEGQWLELSRPPILNERQEYVTNARRLSR